MYLRRKFIRVFIPNFGETTLELKVLQKINDFISGRNFISVFILELTVLIIAIIMTLYSLMFLIFIGNVPN